MRIACIGVRAGALFGAVAFAVGVGSAAAPEGRWVAEHVRDRDQGRDARFDMRMRLVDSRGGVRERRFTLMLRKGAAGEDRGLIRFTQPADIKGTGLLVWKHAKAESERFLFLPAMGRVRRIAGSEAQESFVGSDFSYEDVAGQDIEDYTYDLLDADAATTDAAGAAYKFYKLQSRARDASAPFPTTISYVDKDSFIVRHLERLDRAGQRRKTYDVQKLAKLQGFWTALSATMGTDRERTHTELVVDTPLYNVGLTDEDFSRRTLERGGP